jgi:hypothetical protein
VVLSGVSRSEVGRSIRGHPGSQARTICFSGRGGHDGILSS